MFDEEYKRIGAKIAYYRKLKGMTQEQLAAETGISTSYLSKIERGRYPGGVSLNVVLLLARSLEVDAVQLLQR